MIRTVVAIPTEMAEAMTHTGRTITRLMEALETTIATGQVVMTTILTVLRMILRRTDPEIMTATDLAAMEATTTTPVALIHMGPRTIHTARVTTTQIIVQATTTILGRDATITIPMARVTIHQTLPVITTTPGRTATLMVTTTTSQAGTTSVPTMIHTVPATPIITTAMAQAMLVTTTLLATVAVISSKTGLTRASLMQHKRLATTL